MRIRRRLLLAAAASLVRGRPGGTAAPTPAYAASLTEVTNFGNNPGSLRMHLYVPDTRPANPAIVVAMHCCGGSGPGFYSGTEFASLADRYGFIVIYPSATRRRFGNCFDIWSRRGQAPRRRQRPGVASCRWSTTSSSSTAATRTGSSSPAAPPAA